MVAVLGGVSELENGEDEPDEQVDAIIFLADLAAVISGEDEAAAAAAATGIKSCSCLRLSGICCGCCCCC